MIIDIDKYSHLNLLSTKAGECFKPKIPPRTIQSWAEKGLIKPYSDTTGTGSRRKYNFINLVEIGIVKSLTTERLKLDTLRGVLNYLRGREIIGQVQMEKHLEGDLDQYILTGGVESLDLKPSVIDSITHERTSTRLEMLLSSRDEGYLILHFFDNRKYDHDRFETFLLDIDGRRKKSTCIVGVSKLVKRNAEKSLTINLTKIANNIIDTLN